MTDVLTALIYASERAAKIARSCCSGSANETLLVAEKCGGEANARFDKDFKTIADVLAQESARHEIALRCPELAQQLRGEECAEIGGVTIRVGENQTQTEELLSALVSLETAKKMSNAAHDEINIAPEFIPTGVFCDWIPGNLGVWIDPIDATAEFIAGVRGESEAGGGLPCVTVLIGAYLKSTGQPIAGVINQPFFDEGKGRIIWGVSYGDTNKWSGDDIPDISENKIVLMSGAENPTTIDKFKSNGWEVQSVPGAGHKLLKVVLGEAQAYIVSKGTTFRWDTCAPHAILKAQGGGLLTYKNQEQVTYNDPTDIDTQQYANSKGIVAFRDKKTFDEIKDLLC